MYETLFYVIEHAIKDACRSFSPITIMFPPRKWAYDGLAKYCCLRYGEEVAPRPHALVEDLGIDDLVGKGASVILFTNGMQDMWYGGSYRRICPIRLWRSTSRMGRITATFSKSALRMRIPMISKRVELLVEFRVVER